MIDRSLNFWKECKFYANGGFKIVMTVSCSNIGFVAYKSLQIMFSPKGRYWKVSAMYTIREFLLVRV